MKRTLSLDDLALFAAVARGGGLAAAARATGISQPTLGRRMAALEAAMGRRLFARGPRGYALTTEGRDLFERTAGLEAASHEIERWRDAGMRPPLVRITAGTWTARFLARALGETWTPAAGWIPAFLSSNALVDIGRREADIGVRLRRPDQPWLAARRTGRIGYRFYGRPGAPDRIVALDAGTPGTPANPWLRATHGDRILTTVNDARLGLDLVAAGIGRILMPSFAGDAEPGLVALSEPIEALAHDEWLVCHHEARHEPGIRAGIDAVTALLTGRP